LQELTKSNEKLQIQLSALQSRDIPDTGRVVSADESASTTMLLLSKGTDLEYVGYVAGETSDHMPHTHHS
jgi:hypothetical protein